MCFVSMSIHVPFLAMIPIVVLDHDSMFVYVPNMFLISLMFWFRFRSCPDVVVIAVLFCSGFVLVLVLGFIPICVVDSN